MLVKGLVVRENLASWEKVYDEFSQEETHRGFLQCSGSISRGDEEDVALTTKEKKKSNKGPKKGGSK